MIQLQKSLSELGEITQFAINVAKRLFRPPFEIRESIRQAYYVGYKTLPLIVTTGFILGLVLTMQTRPILANMGVESVLPGMVLVSIVREIGPVITALLCAGKIASGIGAELGSMRVTEQIDAMEVSGINPLNYIVVPRILATTLMVPMLVVCTDAVALLGSYAAIQIETSQSFYYFIHAAFSTLSFQDVIPATIKTFFFGYFIGLVGCFKGYTCGIGTESVGRSANSAVIVSSLSIFIIDLIAVQISNIIF